MTDKMREETAERAPVSSFARHFFAPPLAWAVRIGAGSHQGTVRSTNEDHYLVVRRHRGRQILSTNLPVPPGSLPEDYSYALVVADGVGGEAFGEVASQLALETALELAGNATSWVMRVAQLDAVQMRASHRCVCRADPDHTAQVHRDLSEARKAWPPRGPPLTSWPRSP